MPSILFHELIGYKFTKIHKEYKTPLFFLGVMVPDAVNAYGFASKEDRWRTHLRNKNLDIWENNLIKFYNENKMKYENDYLLGYFIHVITDIICDRIFQDSIYPDLLSKGIEKELIYKYYENDLKKLENSNINSEWWIFCKKAFLSAEIIEINGMNKKMIIDWIQYVTNNYEKRKYEKNEYLTEIFEKNVLEKIEKIIYKNRIIL